MKLRLTIFFILCALWGNCQNINIRIFANKPIESFRFYAKTGDYDFIIGNRILCTVLESSSAVITYRGNRISINVDKNHFTTDSLLLIRGKSQNNIFQVRPVNKHFTTCEYDNDLYVKIASKSLCLINDVNFEKYIAGVIESEGGANAEIEYYKAQAVLCRTYAIKFYKRHISGSYNLCDDVHCQAYKGRCRYNKNIIVATNATKNIVLVDSSKNLIESTFYANSGGETCNSEDVWNKPISYLRGKYDPYSINQPGYEWTKTIPIEKWKSYLINQGFPVTDSCDLSFEQPTRLRYFTFDCMDSILKLSTIRADWKLRSTLFCIDQRENEIVIYGKGFGHGVGLSQEGAMEMARQGFDYKQIIEFYYDNVFLMNISNTIFFQIE